MEKVSAFCNLPFQSIKLFANGDIQMCCYQNQSLGNILKTSLDEIWSSSLAKEIRDATSESKLHSVCDGWGGCPFKVTPKDAKEIPVGKYPTHLEFDLPNTHCNIGGENPKPDTACFMCPRSASTFPISRDIDRTQELALRIKPLVPHLRTLTISGLSEPLWKDRLFQVLEWLDFEKHKDRIHVSFYTNGSLLTREKRERLKERCPLASIYVSIDAANAQTYQKIRRLDFFDRILENVAGFVSDIKPGHSIDIVNNINLVNVDECTEMVQLAKKLGVRSVKFNPTHSGANSRSDLNPYLVNADNFDRFREMHFRILQEGIISKIPTYFIRPLDLGLGGECPR